MKILLRIKLPILTQAVTSRDFAILTTNAPATLLTQGKRAAAATVLRRSVFGNTLG